MKDIKDFLNSAQGNGAPVLVNGKFVANANRTLRHDEERMYDEALLHVATLERRATDDLISRGLVKNVGGIGTIVSLYERASELTKANISMDARTRNDGDRLTFDEIGVPIPIFHKEWELGARQLESSRRSGQALDTMQVEIATRIVMEEVERHVFEGVPGLTVANHQLYGYTTHPDRNTATLQADWSSDSGAGIVNDVLKMVQIMYDERYRGPYMLYVGSEYVAHIQSDYSNEKGDKTIKERIEAISQISEVKVADFLDPRQVVMVQMTSDVVDLAVAADLQNMQWSQQPMSTDYMTYTAMAIRVKSEKNGRCGVLHAVPAP